MEREKLYHIALDDYEHGIIIRTLNDKKTDLKLNLTIEEAAAYSGIGVRKLYDMTGSEECPFVLWIGSRRLIKRKVFDEYIAKMYSV